MDRLLIAVAVAVMVIWTAVYGAWIVAGQPQPAPPAELSGIMLAVVTGIFGRQLRDVAKKAVNGG